MGPCRLPQLPDGMRVPESIIAGTQPCLELIPLTLSCHVMIVCVCGASRRLLVGAGSWSPSRSRSIAGALQLEQLQDDRRPATRLLSGPQPLLGFVVDAAARRSAGRRSARLPRRLSRLTIVQTHTKSPGLCSQRISLTRCFRELSCLQYASWRG